MNSNVEDSLESNNTQKLLNIHQAASYLTVSTRTVYRLIKKHKILRIKGSQSLFIPQHRLVSIKRNLEIQRLHRNAAKATGKTMRTINNWIKRKAVENWLDKRDPPYLH